MTAGFLLGSVIGALIATALLYHLVAWIAWRLTRNRWARIAGGSVGAMTLAMLLSLVGTAGDPDQPRRLMVMWGLYAVAVVLWAVGDWQRVRKMQQPGAEPQPSAPPRPPPPPEPPRPATGSSSSGLAELEGCGCLIIKLLSVGALVVAGWWAWTTWSENREADEDARARDSAHDAWSPDIEALRQRVEELEAQVDELEAEQSRTDDRVDILEINFELDR